jgi:hypothetical protein
MELENIDWKCTDSDNEQYGRQIDKRIFEFKEKNRGLAEYGEEQFIEIYVNLDNYTEGEIEEYISAYYDSIAEIIGIYGEDSDWIIAECIFEQESGLY